MSVLSVFISFFSLMWNIAVATKLYIVYIPLILCEVAEINPQIADKVLVASAMLWVAVWVKTLINHFKK